MPMSKKWEHRAFIPQLKLALELMNYSTRLLRISHKSHRLVLGREKGKEGESKEEEIFFRIPVQWCSSADH